MSVDIHTGSVLDWARDYSGDKFHALLSDPPYHLTSIVDRFGKAGAKESKGGPYKRTASGFMGQSWDGGDIAFRAETWAALAEHLHPGAFGMAFSGSRTWHRMAVAIEDAGLLIHPTVYVWVYGSGFPKATRIDHQVEARNKLGKTNPKAMRQIRMGKDEPTGQKDWRKGRKFSGEIANDDFEPELSEQAQQWAQHRYGAQALKPAAEPIIVFQKPYEGRPIDSMLATGAGALNIGAARIGDEIMEHAGAGNKGESAEGFYERLSAPDNYVSKARGRWPANFALSHHPECGEACHADCNVRRLDEQTGVSRSNGKVNPTPREKTNVYGFGLMGNTQGYQDEGGGSRYFFNADFMLDRLEDTFLYEPKAGKAEREAGLAAFPAHDVKTHGDMKPDTGNSNNTTGQHAARRRNIHPTVKPIALVEHLAKLLLPPEGYDRRLLVPFSGSGSELIAGMRAGFEHVQGIELMQEYAEIAQARVKYWGEHGVQKGLFD